MTKVFTHNEPRIYDATDVRMIVAAARLDWMDDDWFEVDAEEVECIEGLTGSKYPEHKKLNLICIEHSNGSTHEKWGYL